MSSELGCLRISCVRVNPEWNVQFIFTYIFILLLKFNFYLSLIVNLIFLGNQYWFGLRKPPCQFLFSVCPCLQLFGNVSYSLYNNNNNNTSNNNNAGGGGGGGELDVYQPDTRQSSGRFFFPFKTGLPDELFQKAPKLSTKKRNIPIVQRRWGRKG